MDGANGICADPSLHFIPRFHAQYAHVEGHSQAISMFSWPTCGKPGSSNDDQSSRRFFQCNRGFSLVASMPRAHLCIGVEGGPFFIDTTSDFYLRGACIVSAHFVVHADSFIQIPALEYVVRGGGSFPHARILRICTPAHGWHKLEGR